MEVMVAALHAALGARNDMGDASGLVRLLLAL